MTFPGKNVQHAPCGVVRPLVLRGRALRSFANVLEGEMSYWIRRQNCHYCNSSTGGSQSTDVTPHGWRYTDVADRLSMLFKESHTPLPLLHDAVDQLLQRFTANAHGGGDYRERVAFDVG